MRPTFFLDGWILPIYEAGMTDKLQSDIAAFCAKHSMAQTEFGRQALNDKPFVSQLANGRRVWPETELKIRNFMADYKPSVAA